MSTLARAKTGITGLDDVLHGGFIANRFYLVQGDPGAGKTTLGLSFLLEGARQGERGLYITLSETKQELEEGARSHGWLLDEVEVMELPTPESSLDGGDSLTIFSPSEVELSETTKTLLTAVTRIEPRRVVFDSLSELRLLAQSPLRYRRQILALKQFFVGREATVLLLDDGTSEARDQQLQSIAHGVVNLEQLAPAYGAERRRLRVVKFRGTSFRGGYHDFVILRGGLRVFPRLVSAEHDTPFSRSQISSGVAALDALLGGGPDRGTSMLLIGPAGSGKSTLATQYLAAATARGDHAAIFAFDEGIQTLTMRSEGLGIHFNEGKGPGEASIRQIDPTEVSPGEFAHLVREEVEDHHATIVVIDSLNGYLNAMPEERFLTAQLHELLAYLARKGVCTIMVVAQHGLLGTTMSAPVDTSYLADTVVLLRFFEHCGQIRKAISVVKKRSGGHEESIRELQFGPKGVTLSEPLERLRGVLSGIPVEVVQHEPPSLLSD